MEAIRHRLRRWAWVALVAILGAALAPTVTHAMAASGGAPWAELCSTGAAPADDGVAHDHAEHCALCAGLGAAPPPASPAAAVPAAGMGRIGLPEAASPFARLPWRASQPRGPPARS